MEDAPVLWGFASGDHYAQVHQPRDEFDGADVYGLRAHLLQGRMQNLGEHER